MAEEADDYLILSRREDENVFSRLSADGEVLEQKTVDLGHYTVTEAVCYEDGFLAVASAWNEPDELLLTVKTQEANERLLISA